MGVWLSLCYTNAQYALKTCTTVAVRHLIDALDQPIRS
jgi:hypothetical protein